MVKMVISAAFACALTFTAVAEEGVKDGSKKEAFQERIQNIKERRQNFLEQLKEKKEARQENRENLDGDKKHPHHPHKKIENLKNFLRDGKWHSEFQAREKIISKRFFLCANLICVRE